MPNEKPSDTLTANPLLMDALPEEASAPPGWHSDEFVMMFLGYLAARIRSKPEPASAVVFMHGPGIWRDFKREMGKR